MVLQITCGEQGWRSVESDRLTPCCLGSDPARCHIWVEFVVDSRLGPSVFLRVLQFSSLQNFFQIRIRSGAAWKPARVDVTSSLNIATLLFIILRVFFWFVACL